MDCGLAPARTTVEMEAGRMPVAVGWIVKVRVQLPTATTEVPHVLVWLKSDGLVPPREMLLMLSEVRPMLVSVTVFAELVWPRTVDEKAKLDAESVTWVPVPLRLMDCGLA